MNKNLLIIPGILLVGILLAWVAFARRPLLDKENVPPLGDQQINSFEACAGEGAGIIMESYPPRCTINGKTFTQDIGNELEKMDLIRIENPRPNAMVSSPLEVRGEARGTWFFEGSFPISLRDSQGNELATGIATAQGEWMTEEFVPFIGSLEFKKPIPIKGKGELILRKDNPSGLPENDDELRVPVNFE